MSEDPVVGDLSWRKVTGVAVVRNVQVTRSDDHVSISIHTDIDISMFPDRPGLSLTAGEWAMLQDAAEAPVVLDQPDSGTRAEVGSAVSDDGPQPGPPGSDNLNGYQFARWLIGCWLSPPGRKSLTSLVMFVSLWSLILSFMVLLSCVLVAWAAAWSGVPVGYLALVLTGLTGLLGVFFRRRRK